MIFFTTLITDLGHQTGILGGNEMVKQTCAWHWCKVISNNSICSSPCCHQHSIAKFACGWHVSVAVEFDDRCVTRITQVSHMPQYKAMWPFKAQSCGYETLLNLAIKFPLGFQDGPIVRFSHGKLSGEITRDTELVTSLLTCLLKDYNMCTDIEKETFIEIYTCNVYIYIYIYISYNHINWNYITMSEIFIDETLVLYTYVHVSRIWELHTSTGIVTHWETNHRFHHRKYILTRFWCRCHM